MRQPRQRAHGDRGFSLVELPFGRLPSGLSSTLRLRPEGSLRVEDRVVSKREGLAFTLVELLVVITILALLITILTPSLNNAREYSRQTYCLSNQKTIAGALQGYHGAWNYFPYNYADYVQQAYPQWSLAGVDYREPNTRWALGCISEYAGWAQGRVDLRNRLEHEFPRAYICPSADLEAVYAAQASDRYHACYWTNIAIRLNLGFRIEGNGGSLFSVLDPSKPPGWDGNSGGAARISGKCCPKCKNWRTVYCPTMDSVPQPARTMFTGDTRNTGITYMGENGTITAPPGEFQMRPGWGQVAGSMGFDRHGGKVIVSYVDGHAGPFTDAEMRRPGNWKFFDDQPDRPRGDFLMQYTMDYACEGIQDARIHRLPRAPVN